MALRSAYGTTPQPGCGETTHGTVSYGVEFGSGGAVVGGVCRGIVDDGSGGSVAGGVVARVVAGGVVGGSVAGGAVVGGVVVVVVALVVVVLTGAEELLSVLAGDEPDEHALSAAMAATATTPQRRIS